MMTNEELIHAIKALATDAKGVAKALAKCRTSGVMSGKGTANVSLGQVGVAAEEFARLAESAVATLPAELR
jgi:hypothetical protein